MCFCEFSQFWRSDADLLATSLPKARPSAALLPVIHFPSQKIPLEDIYTSNLDLFALSGPWVGRGVEAAR